MEAIDLNAEAWAGIRNGLDAGRLAHAYVLVGSPRGSALHFAESILKLLFCEADKKPCEACVSCRQVSAHKHIDNLWIEPQSKSRQIKAEDIRTLVRQMTQTSYEGGWKAAIILAADCMNTNSANVLLKTLEEPPPKTILLLLTDSPQSLLPTILSRCQKIVLAEGRNEVTEPEWRAPLMDILHDLPPSSGLASARLASQMKGLMDGIKAGIADAVASEFDVRGEAVDESKMKDILAARTNARLREAQSEVFKVMLEWQRDVLMLTSGIEEQHLTFSDARDVLLKQADRQTQSQAMLGVQVIDSMAQRLERNIPPLQLFDEAFRALIRR